MKTRKPRRRKPSPEQLEKMRERMKYARQFSKTHRASARRKPILSTEVQSKLDAIYGFEEKKALSEQLHRVKNQVKVLMELLVEQVQSQK